MCLLSGHINIIKRIDFKICDTMYFYSVLVDKDQSPKWNPATLEKVTPQKVDWYFSPLPEERELKL